MIRTLRILRASFENSRSGNAYLRHCCVRSVIPAQAGIQVGRIGRMPAYAGMTSQREHPAE